jgi:hypothetical protein
VPGAPGALPAMSTYAVAAANNKNNKNNSNKVVKTGKYQDKKPMFLRGLIERTSQPVKSPLFEAMKKVCDE